MENTLQLLALVRHLRYVLEQRVELSPVVAYFVIFSFFTGSRRLTTEADIGRLIPATTEPLALQLVVQRTAQHTLRQILNNR